MNGAKDLAISSHLRAERDRLLKLINQIRASGMVAPPYCWLVESSQIKGNRRYTYVRLVSEPPGTKSTSRSLGRPGSEKGRTWRNAIARREAIAELEQQFHLLEGLIDRQVATTKVITAAMSFANQSLKFSSKSPG